jgi:3-oxoadipate enol-lactonase
MPQATVGDISIGYDLDDFTDPWRASAVVWLQHGYARNRRFWYAWVPLLARDYRVLRVDLRGHGTSTNVAPGAGFTLEQLVADAVGLLDHLGIARVHWVGESFGGILGLALALGHPHRLASLTLCNTPFRVPGAVVSTYALGEESQAAALRKHGVGGWCRQTLGYRLDLSKAPPALCDWYISEMDRTPVADAIALHQLVESGDLWPSLPDIRVPTLILTGDQSPIARSAEMARMRERMPAARLALIAGYGHGVNVLAPERCVAELRAFLATLPASA